MSQEAELATRLRNLPDTCENMKKFPRIYSKIKMLWGSADFFSYTNDLLIMEPGREGREGLDPSVHQEIARLQQAFVKYPDLVASPFTSAGDMAIIKSEINKLKSFGFAFTS